MKKSLVLLLFGALIPATPALAQSADDYEASGRWSFTVTPRYQKLFFLPSIDADGLESMDTWGASVAARAPDGRFGLMATYLRSRGSGVYTYDDDFFSGDYDYRARRNELAITGEYTPSEANVTLLAGYHRFSAGNDERLLTVAPGDSEVGSYRVSIDAAEIGVRFNSALGANSRHSLSAQFSLGIGPGRYRSAVTETFGGATTVTNIDDKGTGYMGDIALGYNVFLTNHIALGTRVRGYVYYVDAQGSDPIFAVAPELNLSFRF
jgi:hypothetical protein